MDKHEISPEKSSDDESTGEDSLASGEHGGLDVDWEALAVAVENQLPDAGSFLNVVTGEVLTIRDRDKEMDPTTENSSDWIPVPPRSSREGYRTMQRFIDQLDDSPLKNRLASALVGRGAFRRFKDILLDDPEQRQEWFSFKDCEVFDYVSRWLSQEGIVPATQPPASASRSRFSAAVRRSTTRRLVDPQVGSEVGDGVSDEWMKAIAPFDRMDRLFRLNRSALLIVDMQVVFADPAGTSFFPSALPVRKRLSALVQDWRAASRPVLFTRHVHKDSVQDGGAMARWWRSLIMEGTADSELVDDLQPLETERVITKCRYDAFANTELEMVLRSMGIEDLIIGGVMTNLCCETTARSAFVKDFNVFFLGDGTATANQELHLSSLRNISFGFGRVLSVQDARKLVSSG